METVLYIISSIFVAIVGTGGILFYKQNKRLKTAEAAAAEKEVLKQDLENQKSTNDEWIRLYNEAKTELTNARNKLFELTIKLQKATELEGNQRLIINDLTWSKCIVNECGRRQPPRDFEKKLKEMQELHEDLTELEKEVSHDVELSNSEDLIGD